MADVEAGRIDVVVVYKVDRVTRALTDFSRIVDVLDRTGSSFVSVTQAFNTTTSITAVSFSSVAPSILIAPGQTALSRDHGLLL